MKQSNKQLYPFLLFLVVTSVFTSCSEDFFNKTIELDTDDYPQGIAITAAWTNDFEWNTIFISQANPFLGEDPLVVKNAEVKVLHKSNKFEVFNDSSGVYFVASNGALLIPGDEYTLKIKVPGFPELEATQVFPDTVKILEVKYKPNGHTDPDGYKSDAYQVIIQDPTKKGNYYAIRILTGDTLNGFYPVYPNSDDLSSLGSRGDVVLFNDKILNGEDITFNLYSFIGGGNDIIIIAEVYALSPDYYNYLVSLKEDYDEENPFAEPIILQQNVKNGYGVFGMANKSSFTVFK